MSTLPEGTRYHHGNLRPVLIETALALLAESGVEALSQRAIARRAAVSPTAPYRHFADKTALLLAVAEAGFQQLAKDLAAADRAPGGATPLHAQGVAYVAFAQRQPALFRLMFSLEKNPARIDAGRAAFDVLYQRVLKQSPNAESRDMALFCWSAVHGLATLILDGQIEEARSGNTKALITRILRPLPF